jgi:Cold shock proteins
MFIESSVYDGYRPNDPDAYAALMASIGPSLGVSRRKPEPNRKKPDYQPVPAGKMVGKVTFYNPERGFGRIDKRLFFHVNEVKDGNAAFISEGVTVAYEEGVDRRGREKAVEVQLVKEINSNDNEP